MINVLISGGIDSFVMASMISDRRDGVFIDYGQPCAEQEWTSAQFCALHLGMPIRKIEVDMDTSQMAIGAKRNGARVIAGRNRRFIEAVAKGADAVAIGCIQNDHDDYIDCRRDYLDDLQIELSIQILSPLILMTKKEIVKLGAALPLAMTWSCYQTSAVDPCGECNSCRERQSAFSAWPS
jgi:7-cyano-7-deazaguanine synthase in queuosine biosynthesis